MSTLPFELTPQSGERLSQADTLAQQANLLGLVVGHRRRETSFGRNAALRVALSGLRRFARQEFGELALSAVPTASGLTVSVPSTTLHLRGDTLILRGKEADGSQKFDLSGLPAGDYALVLESWIAVAGPTTLGQATEPAIYAGVTNTAHKPDATHFYAAGNVDGPGLSDAVFADTTLQTTAVMQRQYRLSLIPDRSLLQYPCSVDPAGTPYAITPHPDLVQALVPEGLGAWDVACDRRFLACKLAVISSTTTALTVHSADFRQPDTFAHLGQRPAPLRLTREALEAWLRTQVEAVLSRTLAIESRLSVVEATRQAARLVSDEDQTVMSAGTSGGLLPQRLRFTSELWDTEAWHDPVGHPTRVVVDFAGVVQVNATASYAPNALSGLRGLRLLQNGLPTAFAQVAPGDAVHDTPVTLSGELAVTPGDVLEVEPWQAAGETLLIRRGAAFSVRRVV